MPTKELVGIFYDLTASLLVMNLYLCGPTASGKSSLAIALAHKLNAHIINCDAYQVYTGLPILTSAPNKDEYTQAPHHLYEFLCSSQEFNAAKYRQLALEKIAELQATNQPLIFVGGSGLYLKFLTHGPSPIPAGDPTLRAELESKTTEQLQTQLEQLDPTSYNNPNFNRHNNRYLIRALEICLMTEQPMSQVKNTWQQQETLINKQLKGIYLHWETDTLNQRIAQRSQLMLKQGAIEEVSATRTTASQTCRKAIGYQLIEQHLDNAISRTECQETLSIRTRQYAKRQRTWFRKETWLKSINMQNTSTQEQVKLAIQAFQI